MNTHFLIRTAAIVLAIGFVANGIGASDTPLVPPKKPVVITGPERLVLVSSTFGTD